MTPPPRTSRPKILAALLVLNLALLAPPVPAQTGGGSRSVGACLLADL